MKILVTGAAGFIGFHLSRRLLVQGHDVVGLDAVTSYYDPALKEKRLALLAAQDRFQFERVDLTDAKSLGRVVEQTRAELVYHLAAQPGVRYSIDNPQSYIQSNIVGTANLLEALRATPPRHLVFASSSSIYGGNQAMPYAEADRADAPLSLYAATKKAGEALIHSHAHLWSLPATVVRFFTVYGPYGRPDMALLKFVRAIEAGQPIDVYGNGQMQRDFTYVDDLVDALVALGDKRPGIGAILERDSLSPVAPFRSVNVGGGRPVELMVFIAAIEKALGKRAVLNMLPMQPGDVVATHADTRLLHGLIGALPQTPVEVGIERFVAWYRGEYGQA